MSDDNVINLDKFRSKKPVKKTKTATTEKNKVKSHKEFEKELVEAFLDDNVSQLQKDFGLSRDEAKTWLYNLQTFADSVTDLILRNNEKSQYNVKYAALCLSALGTILGDELFMMGMTDSLSKKEFDKVKEVIIEKVSNPLHISVIEGASDDE